MDELLVLINAFEVPPEADDFARGSWATRDYLRTPTSVVGRRSGASASTHVVTILSTGKERS